LIHTSRVLSEDVRWNHLEQVLTDIFCMSESSVSASVENKRCSNMLLQDVASILQNRRFVAKCLFEAIDIIDKALTSDELKGKEAECKTRRRCLRLAQKKVTFYISWSSDQEACELDKISRDIQSWVSQWALDVEHGRTDDKLMRFDALVEKKNHQSKPMIQEVADN